MSRILVNWSSAFFCLPAMIFFSCKKTELKRECFIPYVDFVAYNIDPATLKVNFNGVSSFNGNITSYHWDFGDGTSSDSMIPPVHTYPRLTGADTLKTYRVKYTVSNDCGQAYWTNDIRVGSCLPAVSFTSSNLNDSVVQFTNHTTSSTTISYSWNFGDGTSSNSNASLVSKTYLNSGTYTVTLKASNSCGENFYTGQITICKKPDPDFSFAVSSGNSVSFNASATTNASSYQWDFGNGVSSPVQSTPVISYIYPSTGNYTVTLKAVNNCGTVSKTHSLNIGCTGVGAISQLSYNKEDLALDFSAVNAVNANSFQWNFGDGTSFTGADPGIKTYNLPGVYNVTMQASNSCSNNSATISVSVPALLSATNPPLTNFTAVAAKTGTSIYYVGGNGNFYLFDGSAGWTNYGAVPISYNSNTRLMKDPSDNLWIYGTNGVAKWNGSSWTSYTAGSLGYANGTTILDMDVDNSGNLWTTGNKQIRRGNSLKYSANETISSIKFAPSNNRLWFTRTGKNRLYYLNASSGNDDDVHVNNMDNNSGNLEIDPATNDLYFSSHDGIIRVSSNGNFEAYFNSANTSYLNDRPVKIQIDNRGFIWVLENAGGDFLRINKNISQTDAKRYNLLPEINHINDFDLIDITGTDNDIFLAKSQSNAAIRIY